MKKSVVTYEELMNGAVKLIPDSKSKKRQWEGHIKAALALKDNLNSSKMAIAEIAERACIIYKGGPLKDDEAGRKRKALCLKKFAQAIGIPYGTLGRWTVIKKRVFDHLPETHRRDFRIFAADLTARDVGPTCWSKEEVTEAYEARLTFNETDQIRIRFMRDVGRVRAKIAKIEVIQALAEDQREALRKMAKESLRQLTNVAKIEKLKTVPARSAAVARAGVLSA